MLTYCNIVSHLIMRRVLEPVTTIHFETAVILGCFESYDRLTLPALSFPSKHLYIIKYTHNIFFEVSVERIIYIKIILI